MVKNFNNFINEKKSDIDDIFSSINKHIKSHSADNLKKFMTRDGQKKVSNPDLRKAIYYLYDNGIVKKISINKIDDNNMEYSIISDSEKGLYDKPEKVVTELKYDDTLFKNLNNLVKVHDLNKKEIDYKLSKKFETGDKIEKEPVIVDDKQTTKDSGDFKIGDKVEYRNLKGEIIRIDDEESPDNKKYVIVGEDGKEHPILDKFSKNMKKINQ